MPEEDRITILEEEIAHLTKTNEELSGELNEQWKRIEQLQKTITRLETRFAGLEESIANPIEITRPPHW